MPKVIKVSRRPFKMRRVPNFKRIKSHRGRINAHGRHTGLSF